MAAAPMSADPARIPWAKVAASAGKENVALTSFAAASPARTHNKDGSPISGAKEEQQRNAERKFGPMSHSSTDHDGSLDMPAGQSLSFSLSSAGEAPSLPLTSREGTEASLILGMESLNYHEPTPSLVVNGSGTISATRKTESVDSFSEDHFARADSESELGTKPPSLDGKSITSGTTFALDEKESLRPDDSASVKAAEDDDTFSGRGSIVAGSRIGSEAAARAYRAYDAADRRNIQPMQERQNPGVITPQSGSSGHQVTDEAKPKPLVGAAGTPDAFNLFYRQTPDEKLLEALESPKDRIFLLRLEQDVIEFVKDSKEPFIDLPPCNSFCRMLTHKLADYYHMTHQVDTVAGSVRIFRTPFCRLPASLTSISNPPTTGNTPPPTLPAMKIMRRGGDGDTGPSPSKTTSETGSDGKDKALSAKEKLSREEREAAYIKARERIFGQKDEKSGDATPETEDGNEMSRSSSVSNKDKSSQGKRGKPKQRRDDSDSFDSRSQYTPWFPPQQTPTWVSAPQYPQMPPQQFAGGVQNVYQTAIPQQFVSPNMQYNPAMMGNGSMPVYNGMPQQFPLQNQARVQAYSAPITAYGSPVPSPPVVQQQQQQQQQQQWPQNNVYQPTYQQQQSPQPQLPQLQHRVSSMTGSSPNSIPYQYGQLPSTINPADPKSQHPIPGSFNRHAFNPKTQSFVPGSTGLPIPQTMPHHSSPHLTYNSYTPPQQQQQFNNGAGYSMARQGSNNSAPSYHASPPIAHRSMMPQGMPQGLSHGLGISPGMGLPQNMPQLLPPGIIQGPPQGMQGMQGMSHNNQGVSHLPNYGNPSSLPPKPPTGV